MAEIHQHGEVLDQRSEGEQMVIRARLPERIRGRLEQAGADVRVENGVPARVPAV